jgi:hypothetical protein
MQQAFLSAALRHAEGSEPAMKAAALLHISRVLTKTGPERAVRMLDEALAITMDLPPLDRDSVLDSGVLIAGAVDPQRAVGLMETLSFGRGHHGLVGRLVSVMLDHGHVAQAAVYLSGPIEKDEYPFATVGAVIGRCTDDAMRLRVLQGAIQAWGRMPQRDFPRLFSHYWEMLPQEEAAALTREIVEVILREPDLPIRARVFDQNGAEFSSTREYQLFEILHVLRRLEPELAVSLIGSHPQLAVGAARFPDGRESARSEALARARPGKGEGYGMAGSPSDIVRMRARMEAEREGDFEPGFQGAMRLYEKDVSPANPNHAVRECWPSTQEFRGVLYAAGKALGSGALVFLDRILDRDVRMLVEVEVAAALAGLPQLRGMIWRSYHPAGDLR